MHDLTTGLISILRKYMRDPGAAVGHATALADLAIDDLDLPMICLDIEDAYGVHIGHGDELGALETVGDLSARLVARLAAKQLPRLRRPRPRTGWMSTGAARQG
jgi:acyl carrier protein